MLSHLQPLKLEFSVFSKISMVISVVFLFLALLHSCSNETAMFQVCVLRGSIIIVEIVNQYLTCDLRVTS